MLKVSHHGSSTSSDMAFLKAVSPKVAVISVGRNNRFGHPHDEVIVQSADFAELRDGADLGKLILPFLQKF